MMRVDVVILLAMLLAHGMSGAQPKQDPFKGEALYTVTVIEDRSEITLDYGNFAWLHCTRIDTTAEGERTFYQFPPIALFEMIEYRGLFIDSEAGALVVDATFPTDDGSEDYGIRILPFSAPQQIHVYDIPDAVWRISFLERNSHLNPAIKWSVVDDERSGVLVFDKPTWEPIENPKEQWQYVISNDSLSISDGKLCFRDGYVFGVCLDDVPPPPNTQKNSFFGISCNKRTHLVLCEQRKDSNSLNGHLFYKSTREWRQFTVKGSTHQRVNLPDAVAFRVGWEIPAQEPFNPVWTGEWIIVDFATLEQHSFFLERDSMIFLARDNWLIARSGEKLLCIPISPEGEVMTRKAITLDSGKVVPRIAAAFFGQKPAGDYLDPSVEIVHSVPIPGPDEAPNHPE